MMAYAEGFEGPNAAGVILSVAAAIGAALYKVTSEVPLGSQTQPTCVVPCEKVQGVAPRKQSVSVKGAIWRHCFKPLTNGRNIECKKLLGQDKPRLELTAGWISREHRFCTICSYSGKVVGKNVHARSIAPPPPLPPSGSIICVTDVFNAFLGSSRNDPLNSCEGDYTYPHTCFFFILGVVQKDRRRCYIGSSFSVSVLSWPAKHITSLANYRHLSSHTLRSPHLEKYSMEISLWKCISSSNF